jgi:hypothetical protein
MYEPAGLRKKERDDSVEARRPAGFAAQRLSAAAHRD